MAILVDDLLPNQVKVGQRYFVAKPVVNSFIMRIADAFHVLTGRFAAVKFAEEEHTKVKDWKRVTSLVSPLEIERAKERAYEDLKIKMLKDELNSFGEMKTKRGHACPCGSGKKYKNCHGKGK